MSYDRKHVNQTRRDFLSMVGRSGISSWALRSSLLVSGLLANRFALASGGVKRFVAVWGTMGSPHGLWLPRDNKLNTCTAPFSGIQGACNFREASVVYSGHGNMIKALGSSRYAQDWTGDTLDHQIASVIGLTTPLRSYALGVQTESQIEQSISRKNGQLVLPQNSPLEAYRALFAGEPRSNSSVHLLARRQSVLDANLESLKGVKKKLGQFERETLDQHMESIESLEKHLSARGSTNKHEENCESPTWNANGYETKAPEGEDRGDFGQQCELQADVLVKAMACGISNVFTLQLGDDQGSWLPTGTRYKRSYGNSAHSAPYSAYIEVNTFLMSRVAYLIRALVNHDDPAVPGTKMIDNTVVYYASNMGYGPTDSSADGPHVVATGMPGFKHGTATRGGNNREILDAITVGMGLGEYMGTDVDTNKIWPHGNGKIANDILA